MVILLHLGKALGVLPVVYRPWAPVRLGHLWEWVEGWLPQSVFSLGKGLSSVEAWFATAPDIEEVLSGVGGISCMLWLLMSSSLLTLLTGPFLTAPWVVLVSLVVSGRRSLLTTVRFVLGSNWLLVLVSRDVGVGVSHRAVL